MINRKAINLVDQLIEIAAAQDLEYKKQQILLNKATKAVGKSSIVFHLEVLKELLESES